MLAVASDRVVGSSMMTVLECITIATWDSIMIRYEGEGGGRGRRGGDSMSAEWCSDVGCYYESKLLL